VATDFEIARRHADLAEVLAAADYDAVHLVTPIPLHARQALAALDAGKHCACTVPAATTLEDLSALVAAQRRSGRSYMMMETAVYTRHFLQVQEALARGELGRLQFLRGAHHQSMEGWPEYWMGLPPMHYATHAVAPLLALAGTRAAMVHCLGSGWMRDELQARYGNPFPVETAIMRLDGTGLAAEVTRSLFHTARQYTESFSVYGERMSFEWQQVESEQPVTFRAGPMQEGRRGETCQAERIEPPDRADLLPQAIARYTRRHAYDPTRPHRALFQGGGHGGSHPHLVHEFVRSIVEGRRPAIDAVRAADWTAAGICAHESALRGGAGVQVPRFGDD
jgi:predicted dehydrogenase